MNRLILFLILLGITLLANTAGTIAQNRIRFKYDLSGNREYREVIVLQSKSAAIASQNQEEDVLESKLGNQEIRIYPNPTQGLLRIDMPGISGIEPTLGVYDSQGRLLISKQVRETGNQLDLSSYPSGMYILLIRTTDEKREWKIIKE